MRLWFRSCYTHVVPAKARGQVALSSNAKDLTLPLGTTLGWRSVWVGCMESDSTTDVAGATGG